MFVFTNIEMNYIISPHFMQGCLLIPYYFLINTVNDMSKEELAAHGANDSMLHEDFMIGTREMSIDGIREDGTAVPVFRHGNFVF